MNGWLFGLGIVCLLYYGWLWMISMDFAVVWLGLGILAVLGGLFGKTAWNHLPGAARAGCIALFGAVILIFLVLECQICLHMCENPYTEVPVVIVLGAQVKGTRPSRALERRLKKAEAFLKEHPDTLAVLSGGQGEGEDITEAQCMYDWLTEHGIASRRLILEERSTSTEENLKFSATFLDKTAPVGILTNNFHVYRALRLAKKQGYAKPCGIPAKSDARYQVHYLVREFFALVKEKIKGNI